MAESASRYEVEQWLDTQVQSYKLAKVNLVVNSDGDELSNIGVHDGVHLTSDALRFVADKAKLDLYVKSRNSRSVDDEYCYQVSIFWRGIEFFAIETEDEYKEKGAVV